jgi:hypothetical protein
LARRALDALGAAGWGDVTAQRWDLKGLDLVTAGSLLGDSYRIPTLCFGPGDENSSHTPQESVYIENLVGAAFGTAVLVHGAIGAPFSLVWPTDRITRGPAGAPASGQGR